jgi:hypothetical protein
MSSRKHYIAAANAFKAIRDQPCFDGNSNIEVRAAIRVELKYAMEYAICVDQKHKYNCDGFSTSNRYDHTICNALRIGDAVIIKRLSDEQYADICKCLKFKCPVCGVGQYRPVSNNAYSRTYWYGGTIICKKCHSDNLSVAKHQLGILTALAKLLTKGAISDEEYDRATRCAYNGFERLESRKDYESRCARESVFSEKYNRYIEGGNSCLNNADRSFRAGLAETRNAAERRSRMKLLPIL